MQKNTFALACALFLILLGGMLANRVQTDNGRIEVETVRYAGSNGLTQHARLFIPSGASDADPAPAVLAMHGYGITHEMQMPFALELARRGYVVLVPDQSGHGYSDPPAFANGFGGIDALRYLRTLTFVDADNIGLEGYSMGGWAVLMAADAMPDGYKSMVLLGSSTGTFGVPEGTPEWPRNLALVFGKFDEFSQLMWSVPVGADVVSAERLHNLFNTDMNIVPEQIYGNLREGTARVLYTLPTTHSGTSISATAIRHTLAWFERTLDGGSSKPDHMWYWLEMGTAFAFFGGVLLLVSAGTGLLQTPLFAPLLEAPAPPWPLQGTGWALGSILFMVLLGSTFLPLNNIPHWLGWSPSPLLPQEPTTSITAWALSVSVILLLQFMVWHRWLNRPAGGRIEDYGLTWGARVDVWLIARSFLLALGAVAVLYVALLLSLFFFDAGFRVSAFSFKPLNLLHARIALTYLVPFCVFFVVIGLVLHGQLRRRYLSMGQELLLNWVLLVGGFIGLWLVQCVPLFLGDTLTIPSAPLRTIMATSFVPVMSIAALVSTVFFRLTGHVYTGAFINGLLLTWLLVVGQPVHYAF